MMIMKTVIKNCISAEQSVERFLNFPLSLSIEILIEDRRRNQSFYPALTKNHIQLDIQTL